MVCVPCFIVPILLYIWHRFIQPLILKYWNPWEKKDADGKIIKAGPEFPFECKGNQCTLLRKNKDPTASDNTVTTLKEEITNEDQKKID